MPLNTPSPLSFGSAPRRKVEQKLYHFGCYVVKAKLFCLKSFVLVTRAGVFIWENFHPGYRDLVRKNRDLGNRASPASHMNHRNFYQGKSSRDEISVTEPSRLTGLI